MPRDRKNNHKKKNSVPQASNDIEEDGASVTSDKTESTVQLSDDEGLSEIECYENKVKEAIDLASEKNVHTRTQALKALTTALQKRVLSTFLQDHYQTLVDLCDRSLRKGKGQEQVEAAKLSALVTLSLSDTVLAEQVYKAVSPVLTIVLTDPSNDVCARVECAHSLGICTFMGCHDLCEVTLAMNKLYSVFSASLPKGNGELPTHTQAISNLHTAALCAFCLLLCLLAPTSVYTMANKLVKEMCDLLGQSEVDLRIQSGEAVALIYESARLHEPRYYWNHSKKLCQVLQELATDSHKFRAKKDRKHQRASFRDVLRTVEKHTNQQEDLPATQITIGPQHQRQELSLATWSLKTQYQALCRALGEGLSTHITYNVGVRDVFNLGPPPIQLSKDASALFRHKQKKVNRETAACKARRLARNKNRDNRAAAKTYDD